ncbi:MAG: endonuclease/exonuclease/phosphatase family protein [Kouleothrix sp.]|nr:endonuclease/exonuclease/phosphatase family protein [Kouleothrix sp.]
MIAQVPKAGVGNAAGRMLVRGLGRALRALAMLYCLGLVILAALWLAGIQGIGLLDLANIFALYLFAPLVLIAPLAWLVRARWLRAAAVLALLAGVALFGPLLIPPSVRTTSGAPLRVATVNLHYELAAAQLPGLLGVIRAQRADVVLLQELSPSAADLIRRELSADYPHQALEPSTSFDGLGVLSRYAIETLPHTEPLAAQLLRVRMPAADVMLMNVSLASPEVKRRRLPLVGWVPGMRYDVGKRSRDIDRLLREVAALDGPLVIAGDFNMSDRERDYQRMAARLHDTYRETNWGLGATFPNRPPFPLIRIDYVWGSGPAVPAATQVICGGASDHCMLVADMQVGAT